MKLLLSALLLVASSHWANANLTFCNRTDQSMSIAIGFYNGSSWVSKGWYVVEPGECTTPISGVLSKRYYYYYAETTDARYWKGDYSFCTKSTAFTIYGDDNCYGRGYTSKGFKQIDTGEKLTYTLHLNSGTNGTDRQHRQMILGTWKLREYEDGVVFEVEVTYTPNGRWTLSGRVYDSENELYLVASGTWSIDNGYIVERVSSSNMADAFPRGYTMTSKIIDIGTSNFTTYDPSDRSRTTYTFVEE